MSRVVIRGLVKRYNGTAAVKGIDLDIADGEFIVLLGPSGCGKTTTLRAIAGLEDISEGEITLGSQVASSPGFSLPPERRKIGMVFQSYAIWPHMSVTENVAFGLKLKRLPRSDVDARVARALALVGLTDFGKRGSSQLSGGQQQRVALARAIVLEPELLLFDEPLSNLDAKLRERMRFELHELQKRLGITSIYVTHDQQEAMVIADRIVLMNEGRIDQIGTPAEIYGRPRSRFAAEFIGLANMMSGQVTRAGNTTAVMLPTGLELDSAEAGFSVGQRVDVMFRPECLRLSATPLQGTNAFTAEVGALYNLGNLADIYLRRGEIELRGQLSPPRKWTAGSQVWVQVDPEDVILLSR